MAEDLPVEDGSVDLVWCRDVLVHVEPLEAAYGEFRRVLRPGGHVVVYQMFATELLEPAEAAWLLPVMGCVAPNMRPENTETAIRAAGLRIDRCIDLRSEWGEYAKERSGPGGHHLLHGARLRRDLAATFGSSVRRTMTSHSATACGTSTGCSENCVAASICCQ